MSAAVGCAAVAMGMLAGAAPAASAAPLAAQMDSVSAAFYTSAHLSGKVTTPGCGGTCGFSYSFQYATSESGPWSSGPGGELGQGAFDSKEVEGDITGLKGATKYFVRLNASSFAFPGGTSEVNSPASEFTTLPVDPPSVLATDSASEVSYTAATLTGEVNRPANPPSPRPGVNGAFDVDCHFEYISNAQFEENVNVNTQPGFTNAASAPCEPENPVHTAGPSKVSAKITGLANDTAYHLRLVGSNAGGTDAKEAPSTFKTLKVGPPSAISTEEASNVEFTQAKVEGSIERPNTSPDAAFDTYCYFEYVTDQQFNENPPEEEFSGAGQVACEGENPVTATAPAGPTPVKATLTGLLASTTYHLRLLAFNQGGSDSKVAASTFGTAGPLPAPIVLTVGPATDLTNTGAMVTGEIERPAGADPALDAYCRFEFISDAQLTANESASAPPFEGAIQAECAENPVQAADTPEVKAEVGGLEPATEYHYRLVTENAFGGADSKVAGGTFTTGALVPTTLTVNSVTDVTYQGFTANFTDDPGNQGFTTAGVEWAPVGTEEWAAVAGYFPDTGPGQLPLQLSVQFPGGFSVNPLNPGTTYKVRLVATNPEDLTPIYSETPYTEFTTKGTSAPPLASLDPVTAITAHGAHFSGTVDPDAPVGPLDAEGKGVYETDWHFECTPACPGGSGLVQADEGAKPISVDTPRLRANTFYEVKLIAHNELGTTESNLQSFLTPAAVPDLQASPGGSDGNGGYLLEGVIGSNNSKITDCHFEYGPNATYPNTYKAECLPAPSSTDEVQQLSVDATEGQFRLSFRGQSTPDFPFDASTAEVQTALTALSTVGPTGLTVAGTPGSYEVTFAGKLAGADVEPLKAADGTTPLGGGAGAGVSTTTPGGDNGDLTVEAHLEHLNIGATYHFELFATNAAGKAFTKDLEFIPMLATKGDPCPNETLREENNSLGLPECRAYEMVTDPHKQGFGVESVVDFNGGAGLAYYSGAPNLANSGTGFGATPNFYVSTRTPSGWQTIPDLNGPSGSVFSAPEYIELISGGPSYLSTDLLSSVWAAHRAGDASTGGFGRSTYLREPNGHFTMITPAEPTAVALVLLKGVSSDLSHLIFASRPGAAAGPTVWGPGVYEFLGTGKAEPDRRVDVDNSGTPVCGGTGGVLATANAISTDGRVIDVTPVCDGSIWARVGGTTSYDVSASLCKRNDCNAPARAYFQGAAKDGSRVYFTTTQQLVDSDTDQTSDLYACDIPTTTQAPIGKANPCSPLMQVSGAQTGAQVEEAVDVNGVHSLPGGTFSDDGSTVYFTAKGVLAANRDSLGEEAHAGDHNLYVWRTDAAHPAGQTTFVARLTGSGLAGFHQAEGPQTTPDGRYLVFSTADQLVATDTDDDFDVYRYDAVSGEMTRVSTNISGVGGNGDVDAEIPVTTPQNSHPAVSDNGQLIVFMTKEALSPLDGNGDRDAYLWKDGHVLGSVAPSALNADIDGSGEDVYVHTAARLTPADVDGQPDIYDARVGGGFSFKHESCSGETCQSPPVTPSPTPTSPANHPNGEGNVVRKTCPKGKLLKGNKCVKKKSKKHSAKKHHSKKASHKQGGGK